MEEILDEKYLAVLDSLLELVNAKNQVLLFARTASTSLGKLRYEMGTSKWVLEQVALPGRTTSSECRKIKIEDGKMSLDRKSGPKVPLPLSVPQKRAEITRSAYSSLMHAIVRVAELQIELENRGEEFRIVKDKL